MPQEHSLLPLLEEAELPAVELEKEVRLEVRVTGADGKPVAGARVRAGDPPPASFGYVSRAKWRLAPRTGTTDAEGRAVLSRASSEGVLVRAGAPGLPLQAARRAGP